MSFHEVRWGFLGNERDFRILRLNYCTNHRPYILLSDPIPLDSPARPLIPLIVFTLMTGRKSLAQAPFDGQMEPVICPSDPMSFMLKSAPNFSTSVNVKLSPPTESSRSQPVGNIPNIQDKLKRLFLVSI
jgi:hypothetical protein